MFSSRPPPRAPWAIPRLCSFDQTSYSGILLRCVYVRHRRKQVSREQFIQTRLGELNKALFWTYICRQGKIHTWHLPVSLQNKPHPLPDSDPCRVHHVWVPEEEQTDDPDSFSLCCCLPPLCITEESKRGRGIGQASLASTDLRMSCFFRWELVAFKQLKPWRPLSKWKLSYSYHGTHLLYNTDTVLPFT